MEKIYYHLTIIGKALYGMAFFKHCTIYPRWFEIGAGMLFWIDVIMLIYVILR